MFNTDTIKKYAISAGVTFASTFLTTLGFIVLKTPMTDWTAATWYSVVIAAVISAARTALKTVTDSFVPERLGGRK